ncbi:MAG: phosphatidylinositol-specific phospholipase C/glycerophosphodiester phosphodiesterase family protein, partial [Bacteroidota bacterium]
MKFASLHAILALGACFVMLYQGHRPVGAALADSWPSTSPVTGLRADSFSSDIELVNLETVIPLAGTHAHNDYENERPLFDALQYGFTTIEADVYLIEGELYVSHSYPLFLRPDRSLRHLYLEPLWQLVRQNNGSVYPRYSQPIYLMIDVKTDAVATYEKLKEELAVYRDMLSFCHNGRVSNKAVSVFISGNRPIEQMEQETHRLMGVDGRLADLGKNYPSHLMPVISDRFSKIFPPKLFGKRLGPTELEHLRQVILQTHQEGKCLRLWDSPEDEAVWTKLLEAGLDIINTDELEKLQRYLLNRRKRN